MEAEISLDFKLFGLYSLLTPSFTSTTSQLACLITASTTLPNIRPGVEVLPFHPIKTMSM
jgi:hypothetical protein